MNFPPNVRSDDSMNAYMSRALSLPLRVLRYAIRRKAPAEVIGLPPQTRTVHIDVTRIAENDIHTGIQRVVRQISRHWYSLPDRQLKLNFVRVGNSGSLEHAWDWAASVIDGFTPEIEPHPPVFYAGDVYLALDLVLPPRGLNNYQIRQLVNSGLHTVFMVYDLLPMTHPQFFRSTSKILFRWWSSRLQYAERLLTISQYSKTAIEILNQSTAGVVNSARDILVLPLSGEPETSEYSKARQDQLPSHPGGKLFISVGTIEPRKGYDEVLDALEKVWSKGSDARWWLYGAPGWKTGKFIQRLTRHPEFGRRIAWFPSASDKQLYSAMEIADALIINSKAEGLGLPILEAKYQGLKVIARDLSVFREILGGGEKLVQDGWINASDLAKQIETSCANPSPAPKAPPNEQLETSWTETAKLLEFFFTIDIKRPFRPDKAQNSTLGNERKVT